jgi:hypothetical protein
VRIIIECPESILHLEAGYIYADYSFVNFNPLAVRRRTIHFANYAGGVSIFMSLHFDCVLM